MNKCISKYILLPSNVYALNYNLFKSRRFVKLTLNTINVEAKFRGFKGKLHLAALTSVTFVALKLFNEQGIYFSYIKPFGLFHVFWPKDRLFRA